MGQAKIIKIIESFTDDLISYSKMISSIVAGLASYTVINGLIYLIAIRASCKYQSFSSIFMNVAAIIIAILFFIFTIDIMSSYLKNVFLKNKKIVRTMFNYAIVMITSLLVVWLYIAAIYQPLLLIPSELFDCKIP